MPNTGPRANNVKREMKGKKTTFIENKSVKHNKNNNNDDNDTFILL